MVDPLPLDEEGELRIGGCAGENPGGSQRTKTFWEEIEPSNAWLCHSPRCLGLEARWMASREAHSLGSQTYLTSLRGFPAIK